MGKTLLEQTDRVACWKHPHERGEDPSSVAIAGRSAETPPRAWGRPVCWSSVCWSFWKHPHERGEDEISTFYKRPLLETPPRAWGRRDRSGPRRSPGRNTPTSVGKTAGEVLFIVGNEKHPHERGEDPNGRKPRPARRETPPRAWGRQCSF